MKLAAIRLRNVKRFGPEGLAIEDIPDGLSVLAQPNEFGKSTLFEAVRLLIQQKHSASSTAVKAFAPWSDSGPPEVEIDLRIGDGHYRVSKRFLQKKAASVLDLSNGDTLAKGSAADEWLMEAAGITPGGAGPTGLLWVQQGASMAQPEGGEAVLSSLLEQEVGTLVGGERARDFLTRAREDLAALLSPKTGKPAGRYKEALRARDEAQGQLETLTAKTREVDAAVADLARVNAEIATLADPVETENQIKQRDAARTALEAARHAAAKRDSLSAARQSAEAQRSAADDRLKRLERLQSDGETREKEIEGSRENMTALDAELAETEAALANAAADLVRAEDERKAAREHNAKREAFDRALEASRNIEALEDTLAEVRELDDAMRARDEAIKRNPVDQGKFDQLLKLQTALAIAEASLEANRPRIAFALSPGGAEAVRLNGKPVADPTGGSQTLSGVNEIDLGPLGTLTLTASDPAEAAADREAAERAFAAALASLGVGSIEDAETRARARTELQREQEADRQQFEFRAPDGMKALERAVAEQRSQLPDGFDPDAVPDPLIDLQPLEDARDAAQRVVDQQRSALASVKETSAGLLATLTSAEGELLRIAAELGERPAWAETLKQATRDRAQADEVLAAAEKALSEASTGAPDLEMAEAQLERLERAIQERGKALAAARHNQGLLMGEIEAVGASGIGERRDAIDGELETLNARIARFEADARALSGLIDALQSAQDDLQEAYFKPVSDELEPLLREVVGAGTVKLGTTYRADSLRRGDFNEDVEALSGGTREQIAVLSRLAFGRLMAKRGTPAPVFLDDALVYCDDQRLDAMFNAMTAVAKDVQCIILTCHKRAFADLGGAYLTPRPWPEKT